jgi:hypothetical protein
MIKHNRTVAQIRDFKVKTMELTNVLKALMNPQRVERDCLGGKKCALTFIYQSINQSINVNQPIYLLYPSIHPSIPINYHRFIACHNYLLAPLCPLRIPRNCSEPSRDFFQGSSEIALFEGSWGQRRGNKGSLPGAKHRVIRAMRVRRTSRVMRTIRMTRKFDKLSTPVLGGASLAVGPSALELK